MIARTKAEQPLLAVPDVGSTPWATAMLLAGHEVRNLLWAGTHLNNKVWYWDKDFGALMWCDFVAGGCGPVGRNDAVHWLTINLDLTEVWLIGEPAGDPDEAEPETFEDVLKELPKEMKKVRGWELREVITFSSGDYGRIIVGFRGRKYHLNGGKLTPI